MSGYINISRDILNNPVVCKDSTNLAVMVWLIKEAAYTEHDVWFGGKVITLKPGQLVTGRRIIGEQLNEQQSHIERTLKLFETAQLIEQQTNSRGRLISLLFMMPQEKSEQQNEQQVNNERTASEQQADSNLDTTKLNNTTKGTKDTNATKEVEVVSYDTPSKRKPRQPAYDPTPAIDESTLPEQVKGKLREWVKYKTEKREKYQETGFKVLLNKIQRNVDEHGESAVMDVIDLSMANGYSGIVWDKIRPSPYQRAAPGSDDDPLMKIIRGEA